MREIVLDTETTGFEPSEGHRLVEIGCVEIINKIPTKNVYHQYINPERDMPAEAERVHGLSEDFLSKKPLVAEVIGDFIDFIGDAPLVIHNAEFDMKFLNAELKTCGFVMLPMSRSIDTLRMAREKFPGSPANLDALCRRFGIDNSDRTFHGALLDAELLAEVYLELSGGRQHGFTLSDESEDSAGVTTSAVKSVIKKQERPHRKFPLNEAEKQIHQKMLARLTDPIWQGQAE